MSITKSVAYVSSIETLASSDTRVVNLSVRSGSTKDEKKRFLNTSVLVTKNTKGLEAVEAAHNSKGEGDSDIFVNVSIANLHAEIGRDKNDKEKLYVNYRGLLNSISIWEKKGSDEQ